MEAVTWVVMFMVSIAAISWRDHRRKKKRRASLRRDKDGWYLWVDDAGRARRSQQDPDQPGGEWHTDSGGGAGFDGFGGGE